MRVHADPWGCDYYLQTAHDGFPTVVISCSSSTQSISARSATARGRSHLGRELILPLRQKLGQWVNLRPMV